MAVEFALDPTNMQFLIPFLFIFSVTFGVLQLVKIFQNKAVGAIIAVALAFFGASYGPFTEILWQYLPTVTWFFIAMFFLVFVLEIFGIRKGKEMKEEGIILQGAILFILLAVGWMVADNIPFEVPYVGSGENLVFLFGIIFILLIFWSAFKITTVPVQAKQGGK